MYNVFTSNLDNLYQILVEFEVWEVASRHMHVHCELSCTTVRIAESREPETVNYTGQIHQFSEIGPSGDGTTPRPWVCYPDFNPVDDPIAVVQWQTPDGSVVPTRPLGSPQATGSELFQVTTEGGPALVRGPDYNSPDGEYCCEIPAVPGQRKCVTLSECASN